jgi:hypothetical protein
MGHVRGMTFFSLVDLTSRARLATIAALHLMWVTPHLAAVPRMRLWTYRLVLVSRGWKGSTSRCIASNRSKSSASRVKGLFTIPRLSLFPAAYLPSAITAAVPVPAANTTVPPKLTVTDGKQNRPPPEQEPCLSSSPRSLPLRVRITLSYLHTSILVYRPLQVGSPSADLFFSR